MVCRVVLSKIIENDLEDWWGRSTDPMTVNEKSGAAIPLQISKGFKFNEKTTWVRFF